MFKYSGNGKRLGAYLLDALIIGIIASVVNGVIIGIAASSGYALNLNAILMGQTSGLYGILMIVNPVLMFIYGTLCENGKNHSTVGKMACKIKVATADGKEPQLLDVMVRNVMKIFPLLLAAVFGGGVFATLCNVAYLVYFLIPICNKNHRAFHDFVAGTAVIDGDYVPDILESSVAQFEKQMEKVVPEQSVDELEPKTEKEKVTINTDKTMPPKFMMEERKLKGISGMYEGAVLPLDKPIVMGRENDKCTLHFSAQTQGVSRVHCQIHTENGKIILQDLGSSYGVEINGREHLNPGESAKLEVGTTFTIGKDQTFLVI